MQVIEKKISLKYQRPGVIPELCMGLEINPLVSENMQFVFLCILVFSVPYGLHTALSPMDCTHTITPHSLHSCSLGPFSLTPRKKKK